MATTAVGAGPSSLREQPHELLEAIEEVYAEHPTFGSSAYILGQLRACLETRLERLAPHMASAGSLREALTAAGAANVDHVIGDTVVRCAILNAHGRLETEADGTLSLDECDQVFASTAERLRKGDLDSPLSDGTLTRIGDAHHHGWLWSEEHDEDIFGRCYRRLLRDRYQAIPVAPSEDEIARLEEGCQLLEALLPKLSESALAHVHTIALVPSEGGWTGIASASQFRLGGTVFLGRFLQSPWWVAEHLVHEALHQKLYDFRQGHLLLEMDAGGERNVVNVESIWNSPKLNDSNRWDVHRVYAAFHVYAHLALVGAVAEQREREFEEAYGPIRAMTSSKKAVERAHYLGEQLTERCWDQLGVAGQSLAEWLISVLKTLDPAPPPRGAYLHLCLDLYEREAGQIAAALQEDGAGLQHDLEVVARDEIDGARAVLGTARDTNALRQLDDALGSYSDEDLGKRFPELRIEIGRALLRASPDGYLLGDAASNERIKELIARESRRLFALTSQYPLVVADAKVRAAELDFRASCRDEVGRLLAVLASSVPSGGRILEIGAGAGVGTGWLVEGLDGRTDVEVMSIEVDPTLATAAREWPWPENVSIQTGDAAEVLAEALEEFDLVFADAAPVKYGILPRVLQALAENGILVIDDLTITETTADDQATEKLKLREMLCSSAALHTVELETASGIIIASKRGGPGPADA
jgi:predicted O-methyltransferase YrrM